MFFVTIIDAARNAFADWRRKQHAYSELMSLDDRSLSDIGIRRSEIPAIVEGYHEASEKPRDQVFANPFTTRKLASGHTWFPWFPPL